MAKFAGHWLLLKPALFIQTLFRCVCKLRKEFGRATRKIQFPKSWQKGLSIIFVFLDTTRPVNATVTKAVSGVCVDPHVEHRIASFLEVRLKDVNKMIVNLNSSLSMRA